MTTPEFQAQHAPHKLASLRAPGNTWPPQHGRVFPAHGITLPHHAAAWTTAPPPVTRRAATQSEGRAQTKYARFYFKHTKIHISRVSCRSFKTSVGARLRAQDCRASCRARGPPPWRSWASLHCFPSRVPHPTNGALPWQRHWHSVSVLVCANWFGMCTEMRLGWEARARDSGYLERTGTDPDTPLRSCC